jgi:predicted nucleotidyltransferase
MEFLVISKIQSLGVFGSYAREEQGVRSGLEILVEFSDLIGLLKFIEAPE